MNQTLSELKTSLDERMKEKIALTEETDYLKETIGKQQGRIQQIQAEVCHCVFIFIISDVYIPDCRA